MPPLPPVYHLEMFDAWHQWATRPSLLACLHPVICQEHGHGLSEAGPLSSTRDLRAGTSCEAASVSVACERPAYHPPMSARPARPSLDQSLPVDFWPIQAHPRGGARRLHPLDSASGRLVEAAPSPISFAAWSWSRISAREIKSTRLWLIRCVSQTDDPYHHQSQPYRVACHAMPCHDLLFCRGQ